MSRAPAPGGRDCEAGVTLADLATRSWTSDFQELAPVDLPIVANTGVFLPALAEEVKRQGAYSKNTVEERRKALVGHQP